jgi:hypothetical protein
VATSPRASDQEEAFYEALAAAPPDRAGRASVLQTGLTQQLRNEFPFDIINLDLCGYTFRNGENIPGRTIRAIQTLLGWQRSPRRVGDQSYALREFTLLYTTRIDSMQALRAEYQQLLNSSLDSNAATYEDVKSVIQQRTGLSTAEEIRLRDRAEYLRMGVTKLLISTVVDEGWEIMPDPGIIAFEIDRIKEGHRYWMLHLGMQLRRVDADDSGARGQVSRAKQSPYHLVVQQSMLNSPRKSPRKPDRTTLKSMATLRAKLRRNRRASP